MSQYKFFKNMHINEEGVLFITTTPANKGDNIPFINQYNAFKDVLVQNSGGYDLVNLIKGGNFQTNETIIDIYNKKMFFQELSRTVGDERISFSNLVDSSTHQLVKPDGSGSKSESEYDFFKRIKLTDEGNLIFKVVYQEDILSVPRAISRYDFFKSVYIEDGCLVMFVNQPDPNGINS